MSETRMTAENLDIGMFFYSIETGAWEHITAVEDTTTPMLGIPQVVVTLARTSSPFEVTFYADDQVTTATKFCSMCGKTTHTEREFVDGEGEWDEDCVFRPYPEHPDL